MKKTLLITGAGGEIGFNTFIKLVNEEYFVIASSKNKNKFYKQIKAMKVKQKNYTFVPIDLSNLKSTENTINKLNKKYGLISYYVNCAGIVNRKNFLDENYEEYEKVINVNHNAQMLIIKHLLPSMIKNKFGKIVNLSSQMAKIPHPNAAPSYEISKSSTNTLTRHLVSHYSKYNINFNIVSPGTIKSPMQKTMKKKKLEELKNNIPSKRLGDASEVADLISFLLSNKSNYINGAQININGGSLLD